MTPTHQQRCPLGPGLEAAEIGAALAQLGQDPEVERVVLFGSRARGNARSESDLDLLLIVAGSLTPEREKRLRRRVRNLLLPPPAGGLAPAGMCLATSTAKGCHSMPPEEDARALEARLPTEVL